jgi:methyltransferase (TIGR00027 family)
MGRSRLGTEMSESVEHVSDTALWIATFRARETARPNAVFKDPLAARLAGERGERLVSAIPAAQELEFAMIVRTTAIDRLIESCLRDGVDMVVNLGAGLDTRPYRMELPAELIWIEVDFPHVIDFKNRELADEKPRCRLERIAADLADDRVRRGLFTALGSRAKKSLIITEGVIIYLSVEVAATLARELAATPSFRYWIQDFRQGFMNTHRDGAMAKVLKHAPFLFDISKPIPFFESCGWKLKDKIRIVDEAERIGKPLPFVFPWSYLLYVIPKTMKSLCNRTYGFALFARAK